MPEIETYIIVERKGLGDLMIAVNDHIARGYRPLGGAFLSDEVAGHKYYSQTMVKYADDHL